MNTQVIGNTPYLNAYGMNNFVGERAIGSTNITSDILPIFAQTFAPYYYPSTTTGNITSRSILPVDLENGGNTAIFRRPPKAKIHPYQRGGLLEHDDKLGGSTITITIDRAYYYSVKIDDIDYKQVQNINNYIVAYQYDAMQKLAQITDEYVLHLMTVNASDYNRGPVAGARSRQWNLGSFGNPVILNNSNAVQIFSKLDVVLTEANIPANDRFLVVPTELQYAINTSNVTISALNSGFKLSTAFVGFQRSPYSLASFDDIYYSNLISRAYDPVAQKWCSYVIGGRSDATGFMTQLQKTRIITQDKESFDRYLQGLFVFGGGVIQPEALVVLYFTYDQSTTSSAN